MAEKGADMVLRQRAALKAYSQQGANRQRSASSVMAAEHLEHVTDVTAHALGEVPAAAAAV